MDAVIFAGGKGSRLAPWVAPKPIVPINGVPIIEHLIRHIELHVERIIVCVGYRAGDVEAALGNALRKRPVYFSDAGEDATMIERLLKAREEHHLDDRILALYGDHLADVNIPKLVAWHEAHLRPGKAVMSFVGYRQTLPFGVVKGNYCDRIVNDETVLVNIGFVVAEPECWKYARREDGLAEWINAVSESDGGLVSCFVHTGKNASVNNHAELLAAEQVWR